MKNLKDFCEFDFFDDVDLHIHSMYSDGQLSPEQIAFQAKERNLKYYAICDHNSVQAYLQTNLLQTEKGLIPGVEFDCWHGIVFAHILGYNIDVHSPEIAKFCFNNKLRTKHIFKRLLTYRSAVSIIDAIHKAGGTAVLAHPACCWAISLDSLIKDLKDKGLDGVEVYYPYKRMRGVVKFHSVKAVKTIANKYGLIQTGGTDTHGRVLGITS
jgi:predicted metal-dependent phosphoesterase TrpH